MTGGIETQVNKEVLFIVIQQFFTAEDFVGGGIDGNEFAIGISGIQTFRLAIDRQTGAHLTGILDSLFQRNFFAINYPNHALFAKTADINRVGSFIGNQFTRLQRTHVF